MAGSASVRKQRFADRRRSCKRFPQSSSPARSAAATNRALLSVFAMSTHGNWAPKALKGRDGKYSRGTEFNMSGSFRLRSRSLRSPALADRGRCRRGAPVAAAGAISVERKTAGPPPPPKKTLGRRRIVGRRGRPRRARGGEGGAGAEARARRGRRAARTPARRRPTQNPKTAARRGARGRAAAGAAHQVERQVHQGGGDGVLAPRGRPRDARERGGLLRGARGGDGESDAAARRAAPRGLPPAVHGGARARGALFLAVGAPRG